MPVPATTGKLCKRIEDMNIGDYIVCKYVASSDNTVGTFSELGTSTARELATGGSNRPNGTFYFVMVDKSAYGGILVSDRNIQHTISWDTLNAGKVIQGKPQTFGKVKGVIRCLTGGVAYSDEKGNKSLKNLGFGAWPTNNEWDKYIMNFPQELIQEGTNVYNVFRLSIDSWCQDTPSISKEDAIKRVARNVFPKSRYPSDNTKSCKFRPAFEYKN